MAAMNIAACFLMATLWLTTIVRADKLDDVLDIVSLLAREKLESLVDDISNDKFIRSSTCSSGTPAASLPLAPVRGIPGGVSGQARCALYCQDLDGCVGFNFRSKPMTDGTQCQLYRETQNAFADAADCQYYKGISTSCNEQLPNRILMQQNYGGTAFFSRTWAEYKAGFGDVNGNYWIGNDRLSELTKNGAYTMRFDMQAKANNQWYYAEYSTFMVDNEASAYKLTIGGYSGNAGDESSFYTGMKFSTKDRDNDLWANSCAADLDYGNGGGSWYNKCQGFYFNAPLGGRNGFEHFPLPIGTTAADRKLLISRVTLIRR